MSCYLKFSHETTITIPRNIDVNGVTYYDIQINIGNVNWTVRHRYKEFVELHEKLVSGLSISKDLLPPKKVIGNRCPTFLEQRQKSLETYLQKVLIFLQFTMCREFVEFLEFNKYDIIYLLQDMAELFYLQGDTLLTQSKNYNVTAMELYAITERLKLPCPITDSVKKIYDFSHILDFCSQLESIFIRPRQVLNLESSSSKMEQNTSIGTSNIIPGNLKFDLVAFRTLKSLKIYGLSTENICDASSIRETIINLTVHNCDITQLNQILLCDCIHKTDNLDMTKTWTKVESADFSSNFIGSIDSSIKLLPKLKKLNLNRNQIKSISYLNCLPYLSYLSLCENLIVDCIDCHLEVGNLVTLKLSQNKIKSLIGFRKMYSLVTLDVSCNLVSDINEVDFISGLPCLEELILTGNPIAGAVDYRPRVLSRFDDRCTEIFLDNEKGGSNEIDMALVLTALRQSEISPQFKSKSSVISR